MADIATSAITPVKPRRGTDLYASQKQFNHDLSALRCVVERCLAHLKDWKTLAIGNRRQLKHLLILIKLVTNSNSTDSDGKQISLSNKPSNIRAYLTEYN